MVGEKILLVEDNLVEARGLMRLLTQHGYTVVHANDAKEAMERLRAQRPNLVLLDVGLPPKDPFATPKWDGLDFLKWMQSMGGVFIPVIIQTGLSLVEVQRRLGDSQVAACFQKPLPLRDLMSAIRCGLDKDRTSPPAEVPTS